MYCKSCGLEIDNNSRYCIFCGHNIYEEKIKQQKVLAEERTYLTSSEPMNQQDKRRIAVFIAFIIFFVIAVCSVAYISSVDQKPQEMEKPIWSTDRYEKVYIGMSYKEVCDVLQGDGNLIVVGENDLSVKIYHWNDYKLNRIIEITFQFDKVMSKRIISFHQNKPF